MAQLVKDMHTANLIRHLNATVPGSKAEARAITELLKRGVLPIRRIA